MNTNLKESSWRSFLDSGMLWWANRILQPMGWVIVVVEDEDTNTITEVYPARTRYRGFSRDLDEEGFTRVSRWMKNTGAELLDDVTSD